MDFILSTFKNLLISAKCRNFSFLPVKDFIENPKDNCIILRHDVDRSPENSLRIAEIEHELGIKGSYYFRIVPASFDVTIIDRIALLGHEIGYHYEDLAFVKGNVDKAYLSLSRNLEKLRKIYPIKTICMHGSPLSKYDNKAIWGKYDYKKLGIIAEPYFDIDFNKIFYITDTGRRWDGEKVSIRDKPLAPLNTRWPTYHSTFDIIKALNEGTFPDLAMITIHPQRWTNNQLIWTKEFIGQNLKNQVKRFLVV